MERQESSNSWKLPSQWLWHPSGPSIPPKLRLTVRGISQPAFRHPSFPQVNPHCCVSLLNHKQSKLSGLAQYKSLQSGPQPPYLSLILLNCRPSKLTVGQTGHCPELPKPLHLSFPLLSPLLPSLPIKHNSNATNCPKPAPTLPGIIYC